MFPMFFGYFLNFARYIWGVYRAPLGAFFFPSQTKNRILGGGGEPGGGIFPFYKKNKSKSF